MGLTHNIGSRSGGGATNKARAATGSGVVYLLPRSLGAGSTFTLRSGSNANLTLSGNAISATAALAAGVSQVALIRESIGAGASARAVEYGLTITGATATPTPTPTPTPGAPAGAFDAELNKYVLSDVGGPYVDLTQ